MRKDLSDEKVSNLFEAFFLVLFCFSFLCLVNCDNRISVYLERNIEYIEFVELVEKG